MTLRSVGFAPRFPTPARWAAALAGLLLLLVGPLQAQTEAQNRATARTLAIEAVNAAQAGDCKTAIDLFSRAEQLFHAPTILVGLGECQCQEGLLVEGTENLNRVVREKLEEDAPQAFVDAQAKAGTLLAQYLPKVAKLTLLVQAPADAPFQVAIDGAPMPNAMVGVPRPSNPGEHSIVVEGDAYLPASATVVLQEGETQTVTVPLDLRPPEAALPPPPPEPATEPAQEEPNRVPAYIAFGVGAVGVGLGAVFGLSAAGTKSDLEEVCINGRCPPSAEEDIDSMQRDATLATVTMGIGLVAVGAGVYLWVTGEPQSGQELGAPQPPSGYIRAFVGTNRLGLNGAF